MLDVTEPWDAAETAHFAEQVLKQTWNAVQLKNNGVMELGLCIKMAEAFTYLADMKGRLGE